MALPLIKWPGGKRSELPIIEPRIPPHERYFEPFFGGGSVYFNCIEAEGAFANDLNVDLMAFYRCVKNRNLAFFDSLYGWLDKWDRKKLTGRTEMYYEARESYNSSRKRSINRSVYFFLIRELAYGGMFRRNSSGEFNVPFGRVYAQSNGLMRRKADYLLSDEVQDKIQQLTLFNMDFSEFMDQFEFTDEDFMFVDPPYDTSFSTYDEDFSSCDQRRLGERLSRFPGKFMLVCKLTPLTEKIYCSNRSCARFNVHAYDAQYRFNIKGRFSRDTKHILVTNYDTIS